jgi:Arc/MetJ family transcription regulator
MPPSDAKVSSVRTTIRIDDALYREVKQRAATSGRTVAAILEDAVRRGLNPTDHALRDRFTVRTTGAGGLRPGVDLSSNAALAEALDDETPLDAMR